LDRQSHSMSSVSNENTCVNGSRIRIGRRSCRRSRIPPLAQASGFLRGF
jgi:hypothetical protein